jgi:hypothetical protein
VTAPEVASTAQLDPDDTVIAELWAAITPSFLELISWSSERVWWSSRKGIRC